MCKDKSASGKEPKQSIGRQALAVGFATAFGVVLWTLAEELLAPALLFALAFNGLAAIIITALLVGLAEAIGTMLIAAPSERLLSGTNNGKFPKVSLSRLFFATAAMGILWYFLSVTPLELSTSAGGFLAVALVAVIVTGLLAIGIFRCALGLGSTESTTNCLFDCGFWRKSPDNVPEVNLGDAPEVGEKGSATKNDVPLLSQGAASSAQTPAAVSAAVVAADTNSSTESSSSNGGSKTDVVVVAVCPSMTEAVAEAAAADTSDAGSGESTAAEAAEAVVASSSA